MRAPTRQRLRRSGGTELSFITAGDASRPTVLLLHGSPSSARMFRLAHRHAGARTSVGPHRAVRQRASNRLGPQWEATQQPYWSHPTPENEAAATAHLTFEGTRDTYTSGAPPDVVARMSPDVWDEDWRVMNLPGRMDTQRALIFDYGKYVERFDAIAAYLARRQPPALMIWGRHDPFFELAEVLSWMQALPRMEVHVLNAGHKLLETHAPAAVKLMLAFIAESRDHVIDRSAHR